MENGAISESIEIRQGCGFRHEDRIANLSGLVDILIDQNHPNALWLSVFNQERPYVHLLAYREFGAVLTQANGQRLSER